MSWQVIEGDCREVMAGMEPESVQCVVTSPPYWGLRDYGTATWDGGDAECDHVQSRALKRDTSGGMLPAGQGTRGTQSSTASSVLPYRDTCGKCGAVRIDQQLGLEPTVEAYVEHMVEVFREVRRVLRPDGTVWLNLGDSYAGSSGNGGATAKQLTNAGSYHDGGVRNAPGLKSKDLVGVPWRVAFALQSDGWWLRSAIVWAKPNPMPESVTDRPTSSYEFVFLLTRSARYFYDGDAVNERGKPSLAGLTLTEAPTNWDGRRDGTVPGKGEAHETGTRTGGNLSRAYAGVDWEASGRNLRNVWNIASEPFPLAHFATFPKALVEPCVKAGTSEKGCCPECGAPWERVSDVVGVIPPKGGKGHDRAYGQRMHGLDDRSGVGETGGGFATLKRRQTGWQPTCTHDAEPVPCTVLDPFAGSGTTGVVALRLGRSFVGIELSPTYADMARNRITNWRREYAERPAPKVIDGQEVFAL